MAGTPWHIERMHREDGDPRRHKSRCRYYYKKTKDEDAFCAKNYGNCYGSAHCLYYDEGDGDSSLKIPQKPLEIPSKKVLPFEGIKKIQMKDIIVSPNISIPTADTISNAIIYYQLNGTLERPIQVVCQDDKYRLEGGKPQYYAAQRLGLKTINAVLYSEFQKEHYHPGRKVIHKTYGRGTVQQRDDTMISILFENGETKVFKLKHCLDNGIISLVKSKGKKNKHKKYWLKYK